MHLLQMVRESGCLSLMCPPLMVMYYTGPSFGNSSIYQYMTGLICQTPKNLSIYTKQLRMALLNLSSRDSHAQVRITMKPLTVSSHVKIILVFYIVKELRRLHDTVQQHLRALKAMGSEPDESFITSVIELKLDVEWQRHSQDKTEVPSSYSEILEFLDLRAQASETSLSSSSKKPPTKKPFTPVTTLTGKSESMGNCILCNGEQHPLYICPKFKVVSHSDKMSTLRKSNFCINCFNG